MQGTWQSKRSGNCGLPGERVSGSRLQLARSGNLIRLLVKFCAHGLWIFGFVAQSF